jgi:hypothetical protein
LIVRAGQDQFAGLNASIDRFVAGALTRDLPISVLNLPGAPHGFEIALDSAASKAAIRQVVAFMKAHLMA